MQLIKSNVFCRDWREVAMHKEAGRDVLLPSRLQREHGREDTLMLDFWPPEL